MTNGRIEKIASRLCSVQIMLKHISPFKRHEDAASAPTVDAAPMAAAHTTTAASVIATHANTVNAAHTLAGKPSLTSIYSISPSFFPLRTHLTGGDFANLTRTNRQPHQACERIRPQQQATVPDYSRSYYILVPNGKAQCYHWGSFAYNSLPGTLVETASVWPSLRVHIDYQDDPDGFALNQEESEHFEFREELVFASLIRS